MLSSAVSRIAFFNVNKDLSMKAPIEVVEWANAHWMTLKERAQAKKNELLLAASRGYTGKVQRGRNHILFLKLAKLAGDRDV